MPAGGPASDLDHRAPIGPGSVVLLCDAVSSRRDRVCEFIAGAGASPRIIEATPAPSPHELAGCVQIALVAVGSGFEQGQPVFDLMERLKRAGFDILAYEAGVQHWPVRSKCLPLLAGAARLLDSGSAGFPAEVRQLLHQALQALAGKCREQREICEAMLRHGMAGESAAITGAFRLAMRFSSLSDLPVLITGDTGTGKELMARAISKMDPKRQAGPFIPVNCAAVNPALMESEFFGHRRGAFTGAERDRKGLIRAAEGGTLFLDEIGELEIGLQAKLLRVLQENSVLGVGEEREAPVNVRFIAATNRNLEQLVAERKFRADLLHRLRVLLIHIPPLHERPADLPPLIGHFLRKHHSLQPGSTATVTRDFLDAVRQLELPGNVRQLENLVRQALANHRSARGLDLNDLPEEALRQLAGPFSTGTASGAAAASEPPSELAELPQKQMNELVRRILDRQGWNLSGALHEYERFVFAAAMDRTHGNQSQAARLLGITARSVYNKVRKYRLPAGSEAAAVGKS